MQDNIFQSVMSPGASLLPYPDPADSQRNIIRNNDQFLLRVYLKIIGDLPHALPA